MRSLFAALLLGLALPAFAADAADLRAPLESGKPSPFNEEADAKADIRNALVAAQKEGKKVMLVFGANWCPYCRGLVRDFDQGETAKVVASHYQVVKVNLGRRDRNQDLAEVYGNPQAKGIPAMVILNSDGSVQTKLDGMELSNIRVKGLDAVTSMLKEQAGKKAS
ncbi:thioredoxin family protein [Chitinimonas lacunae]|uniref:Thioredoxin family protein n=1 Tax=Chitinimonas lacunae TaxID=1963018 RepID=A0ABV8MRE4_9NEIS